jgi:hypothetical protein
LRSALAIIRVMRWLFNHGLIGHKGADRFFRTAKVVERQADRLLMTRNRTY